MRIKTPHGVNRLDHAPSFKDTLGRETGEMGRSLACDEAYGRWVPGGDSGLYLEELADKVIEGTLDYDTAVRLTEAIKDVGGTQCATKRDLLVVLSRKREAHHSEE